MNWKSSITFAVIAILVIVSVFLLPFGESAVAWSGADSGRLEGAWRVELTPKNCQTGTPNPHFFFLVSFAQGGTMTEVMNNPVFLPGQRATGLGAWRHTQSNTYKAAWDTFILFDSQGFKRGVQRLAWDITVDGDQITFESTSKFLDIDGNVLGSTCGSGTGTRIELPPDQD